MPNMVTQEPRLRSVGVLRGTVVLPMAYWEWGDPANDRVVVCVHGLSRQGRDFDELARDLSSEFRVVCPDVLGRGESAWLEDPAGYAVPAYAADMVSLLARLDARQLHWVGTSMGGLIGMVLGALRGVQLDRMVLNDVGPVLQWDALQRIGQYLGAPVSFQTVEEGAQALALISASFGPHSTEQWMALSRPMLRSTGDGRWKLHYDPRIAEPFKVMTPALVAQGEAGLWACYDALRCPTLLLRGASSDLLSPATAQAMTQRGPGARLVEFAGVGHAPTLVQADQRACIREFLTA